MKTFEYTEPALQELCDWLNRNKLEKFVIVKNKLHIQHNYSTGSITEPINEQGAYQAFLNNSFNEYVKNGNPLSIKDVKFFNDGAALRFEHIRTKAVSDGVYQDKFYVNPETLCYEWE